MEILNVHQAKTHLSRLLERVAQGEEIVIAKSGRPVARLVAISEAPRQPGRLKGKIHMADDFDAPLPEAPRTAQPPRPFAGRLPLTQELLDRAKADGRE
jgi:prevent-host-death family protein